MRRGLDVSVNQRRREKGTKIVVEKRKGRKRKENTGMGAKYRGRRKEGESNLHSL